MGAFLDKPKTEKFNESGSAAHGALRYGLASMQGWRVEMEDAHIARTSLTEPLDDAAFFAVFDGHAGAKIARHSASGLLDAVLQTPELKLVSLEVAAALKQSEIGDTTDQAAQNEESDQTSTMAARKPAPRMQLDGRQAQLVAGGLKSGFLAFDERMRTLPQLFSENERSGATAVCALISPSHIFLSNLGDSRAVLARGQRLYFATEDHKPYLPKERERIVNAGGSVMIQRVNGSLAVSRALGDYDYKSVPRLTPCQQLVSPEPDVYVIERDNSPYAPMGTPSEQRSRSPSSADFVGSAGMQPSPPVTCASTPMSPSPSGPVPPVSAPASPAVTLLSPLRSTLPTTTTLAAGGGMSGSATPDVACAGCGRDEFLILACDGVFDVMSNQELCDFVRSRLLITNRLELICNQILDSCLSKGSRDNMSIILVTFPGAPQVSTDAVAREQQFEFHLRERIEEIVQRRDNLIDVDVEYVLRALINQEIPGSPPGAGLHAMRSLVESTLESIKAKRKSTTPTTTSSAAAAVGGAAAPISSTTATPGVASVAGVPEKSPTPASKKLGRLFS